MQCNKLKTSDREFDEVQKEENGKNKGWKKDIGKQSLSFTVVTERYSKKEVPINIKQTCFFYFFYSYTC